ncbi:MAG TPA: hypothetical protein VI387_09380 [Candidatus Brocadiales bacterium]|nr:hypothetical protein [Candidatus Brocadiales bacterium]
MKKPIVIDIVTFLAMLGVSILVSIATKGRFGEGGSALISQRIANYCIISTVAIMVVAVNKFFLKYTIPVNSPINLSLGFGIVTATASTVSTPLAIGITIAGAICLWVCVASDEEIVNKQLFVIDAVIMYTLVLGILYYVPVWYGQVLTPR